MPPARTDDEDPREPQVETFRFDGGDRIPNNPDLPVLFMHGAIDPGQGPAAIRRRLEANGWGGTWQYTVFDFHHYHPNAHEVLAVAEGWADLTLGGPDGETVRVEAGDVLVLPAGTGHRRAEASPDFLVCGGYPRGQEDYETVRIDQPSQDNVRERIAAVPRPGSDPICGATGPLVRLWQARG